MTRSYNYKPTNLAFMKALLSEGDSLHLLKNKPYDILTEYLINLSNTYQDEGIPTFKEIKEILPKVNFRKWLPLMLDDLFFLNWYHPILFKRSQEASLVNFGVSFKFAENSIITGGYKIWTNGELNLHDSVHLPILETIVPTSYFKVTDIIKSFQAGAMVTDITLTYRMGDRYQDWLIQRALYEKRMTESELILFERHQISDLLKKWYG